MKIKLSKSQWEAIGKKAGWEGNPIEFDKGDDRMGMDMPDEFDKAEARGYELANEILGKPVKNVVNWKLSELSSAYEALTEVNTTSTDDEDALSYPIHRLMSAISSKVQGWNR